MKSYNGGFIVKNNNNRKQKEGNEKNNGTEFITGSVLFTCQYFTHKDFFLLLFLYTGSCQLLHQINCQKM